MHRAWIGHIRTGWQALLDSPGGPGRVARGAAAGVFAAMVPAFGAHLMLALLACILLRGTRAAAIAACLLVGNPLTHLLIVPTAYAIGRAVLPDPPRPREAWLPAWVGQALPVAEEALAGGAVLGAVAAVPAYFGILALLRRRAAGRR
jgi:uncharacterized protein (DUF2062 family)